jgi:hypothetical protein
LSSFWLTLKQQWTIKISSPLFSIFSLAAITFKSSPLKPLNQIKPHLAGMVPGWVPFKIMSDSPALHSRWPLLLKIEFFSNGQNCSILSRLVDIGSVVSEEKIFFKFHPSFFLICIIGQNRQKFTVHKKSCNIC